MIVMRHGTSGAPYLAAEVFSGSVLNGGDGWHAHPTQALLDLYTMRAHLGDLRGKKVVILGDVLHSRVARSNVWTLTAMGADLWICGPTTILRGFDTWAARWANGRGPAGHGGFTVTSDMDAALRDADVVMALRLQRERMDAGLLPSLREYAARFGLTGAARPKRGAGHAPGPHERGSGDRGRRRGPDRASSRAGIERRRRDGAPLPAGRCPRRRRGGSIGG
jgi:aspartate carbamoyltransferase catalytic subunit